jgi:uncharacterized protein
MIDTSKNPIQPLPGIQQQPNVHAPDITEIAPIAPKQRVEVLDILRGFAIFGILLVNMAFFNSSFYTQITGLAQPSGMLDQLARWGIAFFAEGKFYSIFSFLFGLGMAIQYLRFQATGQHFVPFYLRRLGVLLLFGLIHAYLFWVGDILLLYTVLGVVVLLLFRNGKPRTLLIWTGVFLLVPILLNAGLYGLIELGRMTPQGAAMIEQSLAEQTRHYQTLAAQADQVYANGSFAEITQQRVRDMLMVYGTWPFIGFNVLATMVLGLYVGKQRIWENLTDHMPLIRKVWRWGLIVGVLGNALYVVAGDATNRTLPSLQLLLALTGQTLGAPALALFYMTSLILLFQRPAWHRRLRPLAYVGRMAISNYLLQTLICTTLFYSYGFGLYGQIDVLTGVGLTVVIYVLQIPLSRLWLSRFRFGPIEWLWRTLSYGQRQPLMA